MSRTNLDIVSFLAEINHWNIFINGYMVIFNNTSVEISPLIPRETQVLAFLKVVSVKIKRDLPL